MNENELNISFPNPEAKWKFIDLITSSYGMRFLTANGVEVSSFTTCEKGEPEDTTKYGTAGWIEFE